MAVTNHFPDLPPYQPPQQGFVSILPPSFVPYAELMRLHRSTGYFAFELPHIIGTLWAAAALGSTAPTLTQLLQVNLVFMVGSLWLRGAACTWNDTLDAPFDRLVVRSRHRPIARGAVAPAKAHIFTLVQSAICLALLNRLPRTCQVPAALLVATQCLYPLAKRFTNYPQVLLGFSVGLGQLVGAAAMGLDVMAPMSVGVRSVVGSMYLANVINTMIFDAVYAHQDLKDDLKAGVKSVAVAWQGQAKTVLGFLAMIEVGLLELAGVRAGFGWSYTIVTVMGTALVLGTMLRRVDLENPSSCSWWFTHLIWYTGASLIVGLGLQYANRV
ncbi:MAG: hypothetical protein Q9160_003811 [Pyrenula sp. 1 TL-2023]